MLTDRRTKSAGSTMDKHHSAQTSSKTTESRVYHCRETLSLVFALVLLTLGGLLTQQFNSYLWSRPVKAGVANSTLGFSQIYAVSRRYSPRQKALLSAADLTGLEITIPPQPAWNETDIRAIQAPWNSTVTRGSALAWLGHLNVLQHFLLTPGETALMLEDDVDWDTHIRTQQIPQTAYAIRELLGSRQSFYGAVDQWDVIWLGHCGDVFRASQGAAISKIKSYVDPTMPPPKDLHSRTREFMKEIGADQPQQRLVHESVSPLCSFAYGVTKSAARKIVNELAAREPVRPAEHPCEAYDVRLLESCRDEGLRCITVNPELFHHSSVQSEIALVSQGQRGGPFEEGNEASPNIRCSARSKKWRALEDSMSNSATARDVVRQLAEESPGCEIDRL